MQSTKQQTSEQPSTTEMYRKLREARQRLPYTEFVEQNLQDTLKTHLAVLDLAMQHICTTDGTPSANERSELLVFWTDTLHNVRLLMEMFDFADKALQGEDYNPSQEGEYLYYSSVADETRTFSVYPE